MNYREIRQQIVYMLELLRDQPKRMEKPVIYHLDVGAMYPNIILSNRLQPSAIASREICASCPYNNDCNNCKRIMTWKWRGDYLPLNRQEFDQIENQYRKDKHDQVDEVLPAEVKRRAKEYCRKVYHRMKETKVELRETTICQREHPFYVNTIKAFRDRRYEYCLIPLFSRYKKLTKVAAKKVKEEEKTGDPVKVAAAKSLVLLYDSLQLAHKCILNSFYGYVMRKGARWRSMQMAGVTTHLGGTIITVGFRSVIRQ